MTEGIYLFFNRYFKYGTFLKFVQSTLKRHVRHVSARMAAVGGPSDWRLVRSASTTWGLCGRPRWRQGTENSSWVAAFGAKIQARCYRVYYSRIIVDFSPVPLEVPPGVQLCTRSVRACVQLYLCINVYTPSYYRTKFSTS